MMTKDHHQDQKMFWCEFPYVQRKCIWNNWFALAKAFKRLSQGTPILPLQIPIPSLQILITLRFLVCGISHRETGDLCGLSESTLCKKSTQGLHFYMWTERGLHQCCWPGLLQDSMNIGILWQVSHAWSAFSPCPAAWFRDIGCWLVLLDADGFWWIVMAAAGDVAWSSRLFSGSSKIPVNIRLSWYRK